MARCVVIATSLDLHMLTTSRLLLKAQWSRFVYSLSLALSDPVLITCAISAFGVDDPLNQFFADWYGIVMGTSHEEPMMRSTPVEWNLFGSGPWDYGSNSKNIYNFWVNGTERAKPFEGIFTMGMRGKWLRADFLLDWYAHYVLRRG